MAQQWQAIATWRPTPWDDSSAPVEPSHHQLHRTVCEVDAKGYQLFTTRSAHQITNTDMVTSPDLIRRRAVSQWVDDLLHEDLVNEYSSSIAMLFHAAISLCNREEQRDGGDMQGIFSALQGPLRQREIGRECKGMFRVVRNALCSPKRPGPRSFRHDCVLLSLRTQENRRRSRYLP